MAKTLTKIICGVALGIAAVLGTTETCNSPKKNSEIVRNLDEFGLIIPDGYKQIKDSREFNSDSFGIRSEVYDKRPLLTRMWEVHVENCPLEKYAPAQGIKDLSLQSFLGTYEDSEGNQVHLTAKKYPQNTEMDLRHSPLKEPTFYILQRNIIYEISSKDYNSASKFVECLINSNPHIDSIKFSIIESKKEPPLPGKIYNAVEKVLN